MSVGIPARQSEWTAWSHEARRRPNWDRTGETQGCVLWQKPAKGQQQLDKKPTLSCLASGDRDSAYDESRPLRFKLCYDVVTHGHKGKPHFCRRRPGRNGAPVL